MFKNLLSLRTKDIVCLTLLAIVLASPRAGAEEYLPLYRFYNTKIHQHEYTNSETEAEKWRKDPNKNDEGSIGWLPTQPGDEVSRLYRARKSNGRHYYYTVKPRGFNNFVLEPTVMYVYKRKGAGRVAIHGTCLSGGEDMFFTRSRDEVEQVIEDTKNAIGNKRRKFYNAFYILDQNPGKADTSQDSGEKKSSS